MHDYTEEERRLLMDSAAAVLLAAVTADRTGPLSYFAEMTAAGTFLYDARQRYRDNPLVLELLDHAGREDVTAPEEVTRDSLLRLVRRAGDVLRDDEHGRGFKRFLLELATRVAGASRGGLLTGRISSGEREFLAELEDALRVS